MYERSRSVAASVSDRWTDHPDSIPGRLEVQFINVYLASPAPLMEVNGKSPWVSWQENDLSLSRSDLALNYKPRTPVSNCNAPNTDVCERFCIDLSVENK